MNLYLNSSKFTDLLMSPNSSFTSKKAQQSIITQLKSCWLLHQTKIWKIKSGKSIQCHITQEEDWVKVLNTIKDSFSLRGFYSLTVFRDTHTLRSLPQSNWEKTKNTRTKEKEKNRTHELKNFQTKFKISWINRATKFTLSGRHE